MNRISAIVMSLLTLAAAAAAQAQGTPQLQCAVRYQDRVIPMSWFAMSEAHHLHGVEYLSVMVKEKSTPGKVEIVIAEMAEDEVWDKLVALVEKSEAAPELRRKLRDLGRTRITTAFVGLYAGLLHFEHRLGKDRSRFEVSCAAAR